MITSTAPNLFLVYYLVCNLFAFDLYVIENNDKTFDLKNNFIFILKKCEKTGTTQVRIPRCVLNSKSECDYGPWFDGVRFLKAEMRSEIARDS